MEWILGAIANLTISIAYFGIAAVILGPLVRTKQWRSNRLGTATALIFFTCAVHHGTHSVHLILPVFDLENQAGLALRDAFEWHVVVWDFFGAAVALFYWNLRHTYGALMHGAKLFEDLKEKQRHALELNDNIVQGLVTADMALRLDERELGAEAIASTLAKARSIITDLLAEAGGQMQPRPGDLVRERPATVAEN